MLLSQFLQLHYISHATSMSFTDNLMPQKLEGIFNSGLHSVPTFIIYKMSNINRNKFYEIFNELVNSKCEDNGFVCHMKYIKLHYTM